MPLNETPVKETKEEDKVVKAPVTIEQTPVNPLTVKTPVLINTVILQCPECSYHISKQFLTKFVQVADKVFEAMIDNTVRVLTHTNDKCSQALKIDNETKTVTGQYVIPETLELEKI